MSKSIKISSIFYENPKPTAIYFCNDKTEVVGSLILYRVNYFDGLNTYEVGMARVSSKYRGMGLATKMFVKAVTELKIKIVCGFTNQPKGVLYRTKGARKCGMLSFLGYLNLDKNEIVKNTKVGRIVKKYIAQKNKRELEGGMFLIDRKRLQPLSEDLATYPTVLQKAFASLNKTQNKAPKSKTAVYTHLNISKDVITSL